MTDFLLSMVDCDGDLCDGTDPVGWLSYEIIDDVLYVTYEIDQPRETISGAWRLTRIDG